HHVYRGDYEPGKIANFLILNSEFPRSVAFCYSRICESLDLLARDYCTTHRCHDTAHSMRNYLARLRIAEIFRMGLSDFVSEQIARTHGLGTEVYEAYHF
ncbi:MAG: alpha-E domain-containing protein, partial [Pseudomonadota bacterium]